MRVVAIAVIVVFHLATLSLRVFPSRFPSRFPPKLHTLFRAGAYLCGSDIGAPVVGTFTRCQVGCIIRLF